MKKPQKMFVVRKYIMANSAQEAIRKDKITAPFEVFIDDDWRKQQNDRLAGAMGFNTKI